MGRGGSQCLKLTVVHYTMRGNTFKKLDLSGAGKELSASARNADLVVEPHLDPS